MNKRLTIGFSPCPNDTFIFDALVNGKIDTGDLIFEPVLEDVETLNKWALEGKLDITKLSFPAFFRSVTHYLLMNAGSALGKGIGPLLITKTAKDWLPEEIENTVVALPGENTTANLLFRFAYPSHKQKKFMIFSAIESTVLSGEVDLGVIIHENRFTYQDKGLYKVADLGEVWERKMNVPIPLGGIAISRKINEATAKRIDVLICESVRYSFAHYPKISSYVADHAQEMKEEIVRKHIDLYVNNFSLSLGEEGKKAVRTLQTVYLQDKDSNNDENINLFIS